MAFWIQKATQKMKEKGTKGSFSDAAKRAGRSTEEEEAHVLAPGSHASTKMKRKANFARNVAK